MSDEIARQSLSASDLSPSYQSIVLHKTSIIHSIAIILRLSNIGNQFLTLDSSLDWLLTNSSAITIEKLLKSADL